MYLSLLLFDTFWWKMSKIGQTVLEILTKRWFLRVKCRHYGKIRIFGKWPLGPFYDPPCPLTSCKKSEKSNERILKKMRKTPFLVIFGHIWAQMGRTGIFFKNPASSLSFPYWTTSSCKKSEKSNERIPRKAVTHGRTHAGTDGRTHARTNMNL